VSASLLALLLAATQVAGDVRPEVQPPPPAGAPNVLVLLADDLQATALEATGPGAVPTPNLDRLAARGFRFTRVWNMGGTEAAVCRPSRAMLLSGRGLWRADPELRGQETLPEHFRRAGWQTFAAGKWHNGKASFRRSFTDGGHILFGGMASHRPVPVHDFDPEGRYPAAARHPVDVYSSTLFADDLLAFLERRDRQRPFFAWVAFTAPHDPRTPPPEHARRHRPEDVALPPNFRPEHPFDNGELRIRDEQLAPAPRTAGTVREHIAAYSGMVEHLDAEVGRILTALEARGLTARTLVVFTSDQGLALGQHGLLGKQNLYECSLRVPLVLAGPGVPEGGRSKALAWLHDLVPTLCELSGLPLPEVDGVSLVPLLRGGRAAGRPVLVAAYRDLQRAVTDGRWKLIRYTVGGSLREQLFDLGTDPWETRDLLAGGGVSAGVTARRARLGELLDAELWRQGDPESPLAGLRAGHPRLFLTGDRLAELRARAGEDPVLAGYVARVLERAEVLRGAPPLQRTLRGPRLLHVSRAALDRVRTLAFAWRWTGREDFAQAARQVLLDVCAFSDWNPSHFLDVAEMSHAVGLGYDWLHDWLDPASRNRIREGLLRHGLAEGRRAYARRTWWTRSAFNWNQVCNGGLLAGALAVADEEPGLAAGIVRQAVASLPAALASYEPDGAWMEGPGYWRYATSYTATALAALETALGHDFDLGERPGLAATGWFPIFGTGPSGMVLNFADSGSRARRGGAACLFWLAGRYGEPALAADEHALLGAGRGRPDVRHIAWYQSPSEATTTPRPLDRLFRGRVPVTFLRSSWTDPEALWVGVKGGYNQVNHGHLDLGSFEFEALGVRWARDLGSDDYNLPGYWDGREGGRRWRYYRLNSHSHSVPLLDDRDQAVAGMARVLRFREGGARPGVVLELDSAYAPLAAAVRRGVALVGGRRALLVQDEFRLPEPRRLTWVMTTDASIETAGAEAVLRLEGRSLRARLLAPAGAVFTVGSAERPPPERRNAGVRQLLVEIPEAAGEVRVAVLLAPEWPEGGAVAAVELVPLAGW